MEKVRQRQTSEKVKEVVLCFFLLAKMIAETASLEFVAKGIAINEMKKEGMFVALEKLVTESTSGSANAAAIMVPVSNINAALKLTQEGFSTPSTTSSLISIISYSSRVFCMHFEDVNFIIMVMI